VVVFEVGAGRAPAPPDAPAFHEWVLPDGTLCTSFFRTRSGYLLRFPRMADFVIDRAGRHVTAWPGEGVSASTIEHIYLNQVLPLAWSKQGRMVLHASAVELDGQAVAFVARSGTGKSTLAASFVLSGSRLLCDDGLLIEADGEAFRAAPGHASLRLWPDSEAALVGDTLQREPPLPFTVKSRFAGLDTSRFCDQPRRLMRVFFLGDGSASNPDVAPMRASEALVEFVKHSFLLDTEERQLLSTQFDALSRLAGLPIHFRLDYPRGYAHLPQVRRAVAQCLEHA
jgi:hypothetical protein